MATQLTVKELYSLPPELSSCFKDDTHGYWRNMQDTNPIFQLCHSVTEFEVEPGLMLSAVLLIEKDRWRLPWPKCWEAILCRLGALGIELPEQVRYNAITAKGEEKTPPGGFELMEEVSIYMRENFPGLDYDIE